ncbi:hypothetical protein GCM10027295_12310 [Pseudaeromonas pectinilytica]|jgi:hypothetical protein
MKNGFSLYALIGFNIALYMYLYDEVRALFKCCMFVMLFMAVPFIAIKRNRFTGRKPVEQNMKG